MKTIHACPMYACSRVSLDSRPEGHGLTYAVRLEPALVGESAPINALGLDVTPEEDVGHGHNIVVDDTTTGDQAANVSTIFSHMGAIDTHLTSQPRTSLDALPSCKNDKQGKHITTAKQ